MRLPRDNLGKDLSQEEEGLSGWSEWGMKSREQAGPGQSEGAAGASAEGLSKSSRSSC